MSTIRITFLRHAQATIVENHPDVERIVTQEGHEQAWACKKKLGNPKFDMFMVSPRPRTHATAQSVTDIAPAYFWRERVCVVPELCTPQGDSPNDTKMRNALDDMVLRNGNVPLAKYYENAEDREWLEMYGDETWQTLISLIAASGGSDVNSVLVVGHGLLMQATIYEGVGDRLGQDVLNHIPAECEGFVIELDGWEAVSVTPVTLKE